MSAGACTAKNAQSVLYVACYYNWLSVGILIGYAVKHGGFDVMIQLFFAKRDYRPTSAINLLFNWEI